MGQNCANSSICYVPQTYSMGYKHLNVYIQDMGIINNTKPNEIEVKNLYNGSEILENSKVKIEQLNYTQPAVIIGLYVLYDNIRSHYYLVDSTTNGALLIVEDNEIPYNPLTQVKKSIVDNNIAELNLINIDVKLGDFVLLRNDRVDKGDYYILTTEDVKNSLKVVKNFEIGQYIKAIPIIDYEKYLVEPYIDYVTTLWFYKEISNNCIEWYRIEQLGQHYILKKKNLVSQNGVSSVYVKFELERDFDPIYLLSDLIKTNGKNSFILNVDQKVQSPAIIEYCLLDKNYNQLKIICDNLVSEYITINKNNKISDLNIIKESEFFQNLNSNIIVLKHKPINATITVNTKNVTIVDEFKTNNFECIIKDNILYTNFKLEENDSVFINYDYYPDEVYLKVILTVNSKVNKTISPFINSLNLRFLND